MVLSSCVIAWQRALRYYKSRDAPGMNMGQDQKYNKFGRSICLERVIAELGQL